MSVVPQNVNSLRESDPPKFQRYEMLIKHFKQEYGKSPDFICCAPGRVNLIGEHIDYCGYSVLPMAVSQDISFVVAKTTDGTLKFANIESKFSDYSSTVESYVIDSSNPQWYHYILCGLKGVCEFDCLANPVGMEIMVHGNVPKAAGLSSSSAMVCAAALATAVSNNLDISRTNFADLCAKCEMYIGTQGGGMDQSISFLAEKGTAKHISFNPLRAEDVALPKGAVFVITNSCVKAEKAVTSHFNVRVAECKIATQILAKHKALDRTNIKKFFDVQKAANGSFDEMLALVDEVLHSEPYSREEVCRVLEITDDELKATLLSQNTQDVTSFKLHQRAQHVFSEARRVHKFLDVCTSRSGKEALVELGQLINASHESLSKMYECSCPQLDELTQICRDNGALGSRMIGAGWGGCAASLVPEDQVAQFQLELHNQFYSEMFPDDVANNMFASPPGAGAQVYLV